MIYFYYILQKRGYQVNELYIRDIKDIPTDRFRVTNNINTEDSDTNRYSKRIIVKINTYISMTNINIGNLQGP